MATVKVGIGVMVMKDEKVLLSQRKGSHGEGEWAFPGGHLEFGESFEDCARRECREEADIEISDIKFQYLANAKKYSGKHYAHVGLIASWESGEPKVMEPEKSTEWQWFPLNDLPSPVFEMCRLAFESLKAKQNYFDS